MEQDIISFVDSHRRRLVLAGVLSVALIAAVDWWVEQNVALGFLYFLPIIVLGALLRRWSIALLCVGCAFLREAFSGFPFDSGAPARFGSVLISFLGVGFTVSELFRNRRMGLEHLKQIEHESERRREAEEQLGILVESSPAAIFALDENQKVLLANQAAHRLLDVEPGGLAGQPITPYLPDLTLVPPATQAAHFRTAMECRGRRRNGDVFLASVWFSTYATHSGARLAAIVSDASEGLRDREESHLQQVMMSSRILIGAVAHEIRNFCAAIRLVRENLSHVAALQENPDFQALGLLVDGLGRIAGAELRQTATPETEGTDLASLLDELQIIIEPPLRESGIELSWSVPDELPAVLADRHSLLQVFLNLIKNSERALQDHERRQISVSASCERDRVLVRVRDSGPGIAAPERLFRPFQRGAEATGLGLYISRALMRAFQGELRYEPGEQGSCFVLELVPLRHGEEGSHEYHDRVHSDAPDRRPYVVP